MEFNEVVEKSGYDAERLPAMMPSCEWEQGQCDHLLHELQRRMKKEHVLPAKDFDVRMRCF